MYEVEEQLHLQFDSNKKFLNMMTPVTHIYLFRSILDHQNFNKNKTVTNLLQQKTLFKLTFDSLGRLQFETYANTNFHSPSSSSTLFEREAEDRLIKIEPLNIEDSLSEASSECTADDNANAHQYDACPPNTKKIKCSSKIEQMNCFKNCSKSRIGKNVEFGCGENLNNLRHVTRTADLFNWIPALKLSNSDEHFILSGKPLSDKVINVIISNFNDLIVPYSKERHNHRLQPVKAKLNHFVPCYREVNGSFVQILEIYKFHWVVAANFNLCVTDNDKTTVHTVYIFDACLNASFRKKS